MQCSVEMLIAEGLGLRSLGVGKVPGNVGALTNRLTGPGIL